MARRLTLLDVGSANPTLNRNHVHPIKVMWPHLDQQRAIAAFLGALDDKIDLSSQMNQAFDELILALWKQAQNDLSCSETMLSSVAEYVNGGAFTKGADGVGRPVIRIAR